MISTIIRSSQKKSYQFLKSRRKQLLVGRWRDFTPISGIQREQRNFKRIAFSTYWILKNNYFYKLCFFLKMIVRVNIQYVKQKLFTLDKSWGLSINMMRFVYKENFRWEFPLSNLSMNISPWIESRS